MLNLKKIINIVTNNINTYKMTRISRTNAINALLNSKGKFFTVTFKKTNGSVRTINGNCKANSLTRLGYLTMYSFKDKSYKNVNTRSITSVSINNTVYTVR